MTVMQYMPGGSLRAGLRRLKHQGLLSARLRGAIALQAARGALLRSCGQLILFTSHSHGLLPTVCILSCPY
jgi:hypothetical protein